MSADFSDTRTRFELEMEALTRDYPLDVMTARRVGAACLRRIGSLLPGDVAAAVAAWEEEAACMGGPAEAVDPDTCTTEGEAGAATLAAVRAVWAGDARGAAAEAIRALRFCLLDFIERAARAGLSEMKTPSGRFEKTDRHPGRYDADDFVGDTFHRAWDEVWSSKPIALPDAGWEYLATSWEYLATRLEGSCGKSFSSLLEEWLEGTGTATYEALESELFGVVRRAVAGFCERESERQAELLRALVRADGEMERSERRLRLFAAARARLSWHLLTDERSRRAVEVAERFADGFGSEKDLENAANAAFEVEADASDTYMKEPNEGNMCAYQVARLACAPVLESARAAFEQSRDDALDPTGNDQTGLVPKPGAARLEACWRRAGVVEAAWLDEELFGNPARPVAFNPAWATATVLALAQCMYRDHAFDAMPILADALQDAGCDDDGILNHCRRGGSHARGCWVLDLILRKR